MHHEAVQCVPINPHTETAIGGRVSRAGCSNLITIEIAAEQASHHLQVREIVHFCPRKLAGRRCNGDPQSSSDQYGIVWIGSLKSAAGPPVFGGGCTAFAVVGVDDVPCQPAIGRSGVSILPYFECL